MKNEKNRVLIIVVVLVLALGLIFYLANYVVPKVLVTMSRATNSQKVSISSSFIVGEVIMASADGVDKCVVDVFVLGADGKGVAGKQVQLDGLGSQNGVTDSSGKVTFDLTSKVAGQYELTASIGGSPLGKALKVTFR